MQVLKRVNEEWPEETMNKAKMLQRISFRLSMSLVFIHVISMVATSIHISGILGNKSSSSCALTTGSDPDGNHLANSTPELADRPSATQSVLANRISDA